MSHGFDASLFVESFGCDVDFHHSNGQRDFLDVDTGEIIQVADDDRDSTIDPEANAEWRRRVQCSPNRFVEIPGLSHGEHHAILREFLDSDWTDDEARKRSVRSAYDGSIGRWLRSVDDDVADSYLEFRRERLGQLALEFLSSRGLAEFTSDAVTDC